MKNIILFTIILFVQIASALGQTKEELEITKQYIVSELYNGSKDIELLREKGNIEYLLGDTKSAVISFKQYLEMSPNNLKVLNNLGAFYIELNYLDSAQMVFQEVLVLDKKNNDGLYGLSFVLMEKEEFSNAKQILISQIEHYPEAHEAMNSLGLCYKELGELEESLKMFSKAIEASKMHENYFYNRGSVYLKKGLFDEAEEDFLKALQLAPGNNYTLAYMVLLKLETGQIKEACSYFQNITNDYFGLLEKNQELLQCK